MKKTDSIMKNTLGYMSQYFMHGDKITLFDHFSEAIRAIPTHERLIDTVSAMQITARYHCFGDRTLVQNLWRTPWMSELDDTKSSWQYFELPKHGSQQLPASEIAVELHQLIRKEILAYCIDANTIGLLLSGGMDSRIVAGVLHELIVEGQLNANVIALTWGIDGCRDVVYAQKIANFFKWDWLHFPLNAETLYDAIAVTAFEGCEYSPIHLHAMHKISRLENIDCILAASYGDSVGRAEFSGMHVTELYPISRYLFNWFAWFKRDVFNDNFPEAYSDVNFYRCKFPRSSAIAEMEVERQVHYMRRMLNPCMSVINHKIPLYQIFTHPDTFGFMWSIHPELRTDEIYAQLLGRLSPRLLYIPWARTGKRYLHDSGTADSLPKDMDLYGLWIRNDLHNEIEKAIKSSALASLNIFNLPAVQNVWRSNCLFSYQDDATKLDEVYLWLAALAKFIELYDIQGIDIVGSEKLSDFVSGHYISPIQAMFYLAGNKLR